MSDLRQLPHLLRLLDDESEAVQESLSKAFAAFGEALEPALLGLARPPTPGQVRRIQNLIHRRPVVMPRPRFSLGGLVYHRTYDYRGVVVAVDLSCQADEAWYTRNRTQPERNQPWYHILVHNGTQATYVAQTSLQEDETLEPIVHPLLSRFFAEHAGDRYIRNDRPWPP